MNSTVGRDKSAHDARHVRQRRRQLRRGHLRQLQDTFPIGKVGTKRAGAVHWSLDFPDPVGPAAIADIEGTGQARTVLVCADGNVYVVGDAADA